MAVRALGYEPYDMATQPYNHPEGPPVPDLPPGAPSVYFEERFESVRMLLPYEEGGRLAELYALGAPIQERIDQPDGVFLRAHLPRRELPRFAPYLLAEAGDESARSIK